MLAIIRRVNLSFTDAADTALSGVLDQRWPLGNRVILES